jgi:two-component system chemotaxis response regulator CheB
MSVMAPTAPNRSGLPIASASDAIRVMVVDDATIVRTLVSRWVEETPGLMLAATARNGREALERLDQARPHVVVLDVEMPELDGISTLPQLLARRRDVAVIMASALTRDHAEVTIKALALGASDYIPKPASEGGMMTQASFRRELIEKVLALGMRRRKPAALPPYARRPSAQATRRLAGAVQRAAKWRTPDDPSAESPFTLRPFSAVPPRVLLIGASTGGPQALTRLVARLEAVTDAAPVLITQHMPPTFTTILAEHLTRAGGKPVHEAADGEPVLAGRIYLAPGGRHMKAARRDGTAVIVLDDGPPVHYCKPAVDPLFASAAEVWGPWNLAVVLTGMGSDGAAGAAAIVNTGGSVIAQDEATSVVWGMPGAAATAGVCSAVLPLDQIAPKVVRLFLGARS